MNVYLKADYMEGWLPDFSLLAKSSKDWVLENCHCKKCKQKLSQEVPYCKCKEITDIEIRHRCSMEYMDIYSYERKRVNARYAADVYREKKKNAEGAYTGKDIEGIYKLQGGLCYYCLAEIKYDGNKKTFQADHMKPLSKGGTNWPDNIALCCIKCNSKKKNLGVLAYWNQLEKEIGKEIVSKAKELAKKQKPFKQEISKCRKETRKAT